MECSTVAGAGDAARRNKGSTELAAIALAWLYICIYIYVPDEGSLFPKYRDCTTSNDFELYLMCCGVMLQ